MSEDKIVETFLKESNAIEGVYDRRSLDDAVKAWEYLIKQPELTTTVVLTTHKLLMRNQPIANLEKGHYRKCSVYVGNREGLPCPLIPAKMEDWIEDMNRMPEENDSWKTLHVRYEWIHGFTAKLSADIS